MQSAEQSGEAAAGETGESSTEEERGKHAESAHDDWDQIGARRQRMVGSPACQQTVQPGDGRHMKGSAVDQRRAHRRLSELVATVTAERWIAFAAAAQKI